MKRITLTILALLLVLTMQSCNKRCQCARYDGGTVEYSVDELEVLGRTCSEMIYLDGLATQRYSFCDWKY